MGISDHPGITNGEYSVCQFFKNGSYEYVRRYVGAEEAVKAFKHYIISVAAKMGMTQRVIITDGGDCINYEWEFGKGIVFPIKENWSIRPHLTLPQHCDSLPCYSVFSLTEIDNMREINKTKLEHTLEVLKYKILPQVGFVILTTPTSEVRNKLTEVNIQLVDAAQKLKEILKELP